MGLCHSLKIVLVPLLRVLLPIPFVDHLVMARPRHVVGLRLCLSVVLLMFCLGAWDRRDIEPDLFVPIGVLCRLGFCYIAEGGVIGGARVVGAHVGCLGGFLFGVLLGFLPVVLWLQSILLNLHFTKLC